MKPMLKRNLLVTSMGKIEKKSNLFFAFFFILITLISIKVANTLYNISPSVKFSENKRNLNNLIVFRVSTGYAGTVYQRESAQNDHESLDW